MAFVCNELCCFFSNCLDSCLNRNCTSDADCPDPRAQCVTRSATSSTVPTFESSKSCEVLFNSFGFFTMNKSTQSDRYNMHFFLEIITIKNFTNNGYIRGLTFVKKYTLQ